MCNLIVYEGDGCFVGHVGSVAGHGPLQLYVQPFCRTGICSTRRCDHRVYRWYRYVEASGNETRRQRMRRSETRKVRVGKDWSTLSKFDAAMKRIPIEETGGNYLGVKHSERTT